MHKACKPILTLMLLLLSACATQPTPQPTTAKSKTATVETTTENIVLQKTIAPESLNKQKNGKELKLVRVMEGGACKNTQQGVSGMFMLYAHPADVERIKKQHGSKIFAEFEQNISDFSSHALQEAVNHTEFSKFVFIEEEAKAGQSKSTEQLIRHFNNYITPKIRLFEKETTLTITVEPSIESLQFYLDGCDIPHTHEE